MCACSSSWHKSHSSVCPKALATLNSRRKVYSILTGPFSNDGIPEYVRELVGGRGKTIPMKKDLPAVVPTEPWDGKDGQVCVGGPWGGQVCVWGRDRQVSVGVAG